MPEKGQIIGTWRLVRELGRGAFGEVWLSEHVDLPIEVPQGAQVHAGGYHQGADLEGVGARDRGSVCRGEDREPNEGEPANRGVAVSASGVV